MGDLAKVVGEVDDAAVDKLIQEYEDLYDLAPALAKGGAQRSSLRNAARQELGMRAYLQAGRFGAFTTTFEDLHGFDQLPGLACQRLMAEGYGFAAEGDWKTAALVRLAKVMSEGQPRSGASFMEDYTYHLEPGRERVLGAHMLEVCPSIASGKPSLEVHRLGIGGKADPCRLVFDAASGPAINTCLIDLGGRMRLIAAELDVVSADHSMPKLPVASAVWIPRPDFKRGCQAWILAGGAHHACFSYGVGADQLEDFAAMAGLEFVRIDGGTDPRALRNELRWNEATYR
jgi:L-arabinose isomerase